MVKATENVPSPSAAQAAAGMSPKHSAAASTKAHARCMIVAVFAATDRVAVKFPFTVFLLLSSLPCRSKTAKTKSCAAPDGTAQPVFATQTSRRLAFGSRSR